MHYKKSAAACTIFTTLCLQLSAQIQYPKAAVVKQTDTYHGVQVADPYRWLEDDNSAQTKAWVQAENKVTNDYLSQIPYREKIRQRLTALWNFNKMSAPYKKGGLLFSYRNDGLQNQNVFCCQKALLDKPVVLIDPNKLSADGTVSLGGESVSNDGKYLAYAISKSGSDWEEIHIKDITTKQDLPEVIKWVKFSGMAWQGHGFFYSRYAQPAGDKTYTQKNEFHKVYYHIAGTPQEQDVLVYEDKQHPDYNFNAEVTPDENYLVLYTSESTSGRSMKIKDLKDPKSDWISLVSDFSNEYHIINNVGNQLYVYTDYKAPKYRLMKISLNSPKQEQWEDVIGEKEDLLQDVAFCGSRIISSYFKNVCSKMYVHSLSGKMEKEIELPGLCRVYGLSSGRDQDFATYSVVSYTSPEEVYFYDAKVGTSKRIFKPTIDFKSDDYVTEQVFYKSKDGTKIPMFITHKKGLVMDGTAPCFVFGYGGFNISYTPEFRIDRAVFLEAGGIYCVPNIRGGGEFGEAWHKAGTKCNKQNVFDDFMAACDYLVDNKYTSHNRLAIHGRSNGGLLIGAVMTQRPDIAKVAIPTVGVLDMLRFHLFTIGRAWTVDYGSSENKEEFECLYKYSPLHNLKPTAYPATLILTGDHDDRVVPAHSFKFAATLQAGNSGANPTLIRIDSNAGHGGGKPVSKQIDEFADMWSFVFYNLGVSY